MGEDAARALAGPLHGKMEQIIGAAGPCDAWRRVRARLHEELGEDVFSSWFARADLEGFDGGIVHLSVPTRFLKSWISSHYKDLMLGLWREEAGEAYRLDISVRGPGLGGTPRGGERPVHLEVVRDGVPPARREAEPASRPAPQRGDATPDQEGGLIGSPLDPRLTFETYRIGRANALAAAAARRLVEGASVEFNPLMIHSAVGLGKTHLLQAIAAEAEARGRHGKVVYLTAERFMFRFVSALKANAAMSFKTELRDIDLLLIDDMQFLQGKATQAEFCHLLNALVDASRQVVVAADRPPAELETLDERVRSRLAGGLVVEIAPLDETLRYDILAAKADSARARSPELAMDDEVVRFVARHVAGSGRDLDGAFTRLVAHNQLTGAAITLDMAERTIRDLVRQAEPKRIRIEDIQKAVSKHYNVSRADLLSSRRTRTIVRPRQIAMYLAKALTPRSLPEIGRRFGGRDHTTVLHAVRKIEELLAGDATMAADIEALKHTLES